MTNEKQPDYLERMVAKYSPKPEIFHPKDGSEIHALVAREGGKIIYVVPGSAKRVSLPKAKQ
jgi:hypothetical protein